MVKFLKDIYVGGFSFEENEVCSVIDSEWDGLYDEFDLLRLYLEFLCSDWN